ELLTRVSLALLAASEAHNTYEPTDRARAFPSEKTAQHGAAEMRLIQIRPASSDVSAFGDVFLNKRATRGGALDADGPCAIRSLHVASPFRRAGSTGHYRGASASAHERRARRQMASARKPAPHASVLRRGAGACRGGNRLRVG